MPTPSVLAPSVLAIAGPTLWGLIGAAAFVLLMAFLLLGSAWGDGEQ
jgi:hypothetical protein